MKRGRSTGKPTAEEAAWIVAVKSGICVACWNKQDGPITYGCDAHHLLRGGRRIGHMATIGLCPWHHRGYVPMGFTAKEMREYYGPSLMDGSKLFHAEYGSDEELMAIQKKMVNAHAD